MKTDTKLILFALAIVFLFLSINLYVLLITDHYKIARFEVYGWNGYELQIGKNKDDVIKIRQWYYPIKNDYNLSVGDDILIYYVESILGGRTYIRIENLQKR